LFNALTSCSTDSSRAISRAMAVVADVKLGTVSRHHTKQSGAPISFVHIFLTGIDISRPVIHPAHA